MSSASHYPVAQLLSTIIDDSGLSEAEFIRRVGYPYDVERGLRRLRLWLDTGEGHDRIIKEIVAVYPHHGDDLQGAIEKTKIIKAAEAEVIRKHATRDIEERLRRQFRPFVWIRTEDGAHSFFTAMAERQIKVLWLDGGFQELPEPEKLAAVQGRVREHYAHTKSYPGFGKILGYTFASTFDLSLTLTTRGEVIDPSGPQFLLPEVWMALHP